MCRRFKKAHIVRIKRSKYKSLAIVQVEESEEGNTPWSIPVDKNKLVRVTKGVEDYEAREKQKQYTAKLTELPSNASEVLLLRCLRSKGAKSVHIPPNRNGNQRRTATIIFATEEEVEAAQSKPIMYNNFRVYWTSERNKEARRRRGFREERGRSWDRFSQNSNFEDSKREDRQRNKAHMNRRKGKEVTRTEDYITKKENNVRTQSIERQQIDINAMKEEEESIEKRITKVRTQLQEKGTYVGDILGRILERLERLEGAGGRALEELANRS